MQLSFSTCYFLCYSFMSWIKNDVNKFVHGRNDYRSWTTAVEIEKFHNEMIEVIRNVTSIVETVQWMKCDHLWATGLERQAFFSVYLIQLLTLSSEWTFRLEKISNRLLSRHERHKSFETLAATCIITFLDFNSQTARCVRERNCQLF